MTGPPPLLVSEVFGPTLQGEGPSAGRRCGFVRLGGCNLDCRWCDTPYTWDWRRHRPRDELVRLPAEEVLARVDAMGVDMVVVSGGEPMLQQRRLLPFLRGARGRGWRVEVETNGTVVPEGEVAALVDQFTVSPKLGGSAVAEERRLVAGALEAYATGGRAVFKFVVDGDADLDELDALVARHRLAPVWLMPQATDAGAVLDGLRRLAGPAGARGYHLSTRLQVLLWGGERGR